MSQIIQLQFVDDTDSCFDHLVVNKQRLIELLVFYLWPP